MMVNVGILRLNKMAPVNDCSGKWYLGWARGGMIGV